MNKQRFLGLDSLRGIAALAVVLYHLFYRYNQIYKHESINVDWSYNLQFGVHLFFIVSGFVIFWTLNRIDNPVDFVVSRFSRLYPAYWSAVVVTFLIVYLIGLPGREVSFQHAVLNLLMFQEMLRVPHVDGVYWTLTVELLFYFWIFTLFLTSNLHRVEEIFLCVIGVSVLHSLSVISIPSILYNLFIMKHLPLFLSGICFYKLKNDASARYKTILTLMLSLGALAVIYPLDMYYVILVIYLLFTLTVFRQSKWLENKLLLYFGGISYSLYLLHQNIGYVIINKGYEYGVSAYVSVFFTLVITIGLATVFCRYIERPALKLIRSKYKNSYSMQKLANTLKV